MLTYTYTRAIIKSTKEVWRNEGQRFTEIAFEKRMARRKTARKPSQAYQG